MKSIHRLLILVFLTGYSWKAEAQNIFGDTWYYTYSEEYGPERFPPLLYEAAVMNICGDTAINQKVYHRVCLNVNDICNPMKDGFLFRNDSGRVYIYQQVWQEEYMLYDFNLGAGGHYTFPSELTRDSIIEVFVDSVGTTMVLGEQKRVQYVHVKVPNFYDGADAFFTKYPALENDVIEDIGSTVNYFMWWEGLCHKKRIYNLRCFERNGERYIHDTHFTDACDSVFYWEPNGMRKHLSRLSVSPNPGTGVFFIDGLSESITLRCWNVNGQEIPLERNGEGRIQLQTNISGLYFLSGMDQEGNVFQIRYQLMEGK
ncbi:MAG: T9SS type A sorting domain-containing protein [Bacteroidota bacterium]|nr:T9SS type A sorting domain-containing protein [Bacteroidota bacterium]MDX5431915.1 T9SS type A sorting domain-containing protein [Bacteroidota bacterium]MDX5470630.1 T9SS type A sorting domain-containing protein [Bacteroidota bacterium]